MKKRLFYTGVLFCKRLIPPRCRFIWCLPTLSVWEALLQPANHAADPAGPFSSTIVYSGSIKATFQRHGSHTTGCGQRACREVGFVSPVSSRHDTESFSRMSGIMLCDLAIGQQLAKDKVSRQAFSKRRRRWQSNYREARPSLGRSVDDAERCLQATDFNLGMVCVCM